MVDIIKTKTTQEIIRDQFKMCALNPAYFLKKYTFIQHPQRGKVPFALYDFQEDCLDEFQNNRYNIILKSRQLGLSTLVAGYSLWRMLFLKDQKILVIATGKDVAKNLIAKVMVMFNNLPSWLKVETVAMNKMSLELANGSTITAVSSNPERARSESLSLLVMDEAAFIDKIEDVWTAAQQTLATGGNCVVLSTPNGMGNWFYDMWTAAEENENGFYTTKFKWTVHPERDQAWRDEQDVKLGKRKAAQECDADFLSSGNSVVALETLEWYKQTYIREPAEKRGIDKGLWQWEYPDYTKQYLIAADVARGDGEDYSAAQIFDIERMEQVAEYKGQANTREYGRMLAALGIEYNNALIIVERENVGWDTIQELVDINYPNLFYTSKDLQYIEVHKQITNKLWAREKKMKPGFGTTVRTRPLLIQKIERFFEDQDIIVHSIRLINELKVFIWKDGKAQAQRGKNDDLVMSLGILLWVRDTALIIKAQNDDLTRMTLDRIGKSPQFEGIYKTDPQDARFADQWIFNTGKEVVKLKEFL